MVVVLTASDPGHFLEPQTSGDPLGARHPDARELLDQDVGPCDVVVGLIDDLDCVQMLVTQQDFGDIPLGGLQRLAQVGRHRVEPGETRGGQIAVALDDGQLHPLTMDKADLWKARLAAKTLRKDQREAMAAATEG